MFSVILLLMKGALITLFISFLSILLGFIFGAFMGICSSKFFHNKVITFLCNTYVTCVRGTPLFIQIFIIYFGLPSIIKIDLSEIVSGVLALGLNSTAYLAESIKGGINSVPSGQWEAAHLLGYSCFQNFLYIILPQAIKNCAPSLINEFVTLIKESSILMVLGVPELTKVSKDIVVRELNPLKIYTISALLYLAMTGGISWLTNFFEKKVNYSAKS